MLNKPPNKLRELKTDKRPYPLVEVIDMYVRGCQMHGDPIEEVKYKVIKAGYDHKKGCIYVTTAEDFSKRVSTWEAAIAEAEKVVK